MHNREISAKTNELTFLGDQFHEKSVRVWRDSYGSGYGIGDSIKECRPATTCVELCGWFVKRSFATCTAVDPFFVEIYVFPSSWVYENQHKNNHNWINKEKGHLTFLVVSSSLIQYDIQIPESQKLQDRANIFMVIETEQNISRQCNQVLKLTSQRMHYR